MHADTITVEIDATPAQCRMRSRPASPPPSRWWRSSRSASSRPSVAAPPSGTAPAIEEVADRYTHRQISDAWTQTKLGNFGPLQAIKRTFPLPARTVHGDGDDVILTFFDDRGTCVDFRTEPDGSIVSARRC